VKIVRIIARLNVGGPAIHVVLATRGLQQRGNESLLVAGPVPKIEGNMEYYAAKWDVSFTQVPQLVRPLSPWKDLVALWTIYKLLRREKPDVVHTHTAKAGTLGRTAAFLARVPVVVHTFHGNIFDGYFSSAATRLFLSVERFLARFTDRIIAVSKSQSDDLINKFRIASPDKLQVIRLGIDLEPFHTMSSNRLHCGLIDGKGVPVVGWVGRFVEVKDPLLFVDVAHALKSSGANAKFVMVGDGPLRPAVEARISGLGLQQDFTLSGWQRDMPNVYANFDLTVLTSQNEGTPVAMIESMAAGRPFVAVNVGGMPDLMVGTAQRNEGFEIFDNGILVGSRDVPTLANALKQLLRDEQLRARMSAAGRDFALRSFSKERLADDLEALYIKLLGPETVTKSLPAINRQASIPDSSRPPIARNKTVTEHPASPAAPRNLD
jgi:glycosyltransferase involved in cell wall biosynthesis